MLRRLFVGLTLGFIVGLGVAAALVAGLKVTTFVGMGGAALAYLAAALTGVFTGLVAGKPIWARGAKTEAGLKAFFGALIGAGLMFALRQWAGGAHLDLSVIHAGGDLPIGELPAASIPIIAAVLGGFFELDNTGGDKEESEASKDAPPGRKRVAAVASNGQARVDSVEDSEPPSSADVVAKRAKR